MTLLSLNGVTKRFGGLTAVNGLSFDLTEGETVGLLLLKQPRALLHVLQVLHVAG